MNICASPRRRKMPKATKGEGGERALDNLFSHKGGEPESLLLGVQHISTKDDYYLFSMGNHQCSVLWRALTTICLHIIGEE